MRKILFAALDRVASFIAGTPFMWVARHLLNLSDWAKLKSR